MNSPLVEQRKGDKWLRWAHRADALRIIPRILITTYYTFFMYAWFYVVDWFTQYDWSQVENEAVALALAGFPTAILGVITLVLGQLTNNYFRTGTGARRGDGNE